MSITENSKIEIFNGKEGSQIKQYFNPNNTSNGINYSLAQFSLKVGGKTKLHRIKSSEIYYILEGNGNLNVDEDTYHLEKDDSVYVPPNSKQFIENTGEGNFRFLCIVEPAWKVNDEILLE